MICPECESENVEVNGDDTGHDWWECQECGCVEFREPTQAEIRAALRVHHRRMYG